MKVQTYVETCQPGESPRFGFAKPPPFGKGGFGALPRFPPGNVTGHWRGSNDSLKATVRNCPRGHPAAWKNPADLSGVFHMGLKEER